MVAADHLVRFTASRHSFSSVVWNLTQHAEKRSISPTTFLLSSVMPFFTVGLLVKSKTVGLRSYTPSKEDELCIKEILQLEEEVFKEDDRSIRWPVIQLYRNLLVAVLNIFVLNTIYRSMVLFPVFLIFALHDCIRMPFKHIYLNYLQILTSASLLVINTCNNLASMSIVFDLMIVSGMPGVLRGLQYTEIVVVVMVPSSLIAFKLWEILKERRSKKQK